MHFAKSFSVAVLALASITAAYPVASSSVDWICKHDGIWCRNNSHGPQPFRSILLPLSLIFVLGLKAIDFKKRDEKSQNPAFQNTFGFEERDEKSQDPAFQNTFGFEERDEKSQDPAFQNTFGFEERDEKSQDSAFQNTFGFEERDEQSQAPHYAGFGFEEA
ncbi:hypothetical protein MMC13_006408 [Lambiella insularis]|nr:hypothetical protein [Lambiella insularis]